MKIRAKIILFLVLLTFTVRFSQESVFAQSPGGVSTNLVGWFKANVGTTGNTDNAVVSQWNDQAGTAQNAVQATNNARPIFNNDASNVNSNPYITFDGSNDLMSIANNTDFNNVTVDQKTLTVAFRTGANVTNTQILYEEGDTNRGLNIYIANSLLYYSAWNVNNGGVGSPWTWKGVNTGIAANRVYIATLVLNGNTTITGQLTGYLNGLSIGSVANVGRLYASTGVIGIGRRNSSTRIHTGAAAANYPFAKDIMEIVYYKNSALSNADRLRAESYLAIKYGVTLNQSTPTNYTSPTSTILYAATSTHASYANDIAGIGVDTTSGLSQLQSRSLNTDDIVTMNNASAMATGEYLLWGNNNDDNGVIAEVSTGVPGTATRRLDRVWRVDQEGTVGSVSVSFNLTGIPVTGTTAANFGLLVDTGDANFTAGSRMVAAASYAGNVVTFNNVTFSGDEYFTLATNIVQPTVTMNLSPTLISESGGITASVITATLNGPWHSTVTTNFSFTGTATGGGVDYSTSATSIAITATATVTGTININSVNDAFVEGLESTLIQITTVTNGTENGVQSAILRISDDELVNNACLDSEQVFSTELASGDVNVYSLFGTLQSTSTSAYTDNYEMIIDPENLKRYLSSYTGQKITAAELDGSGETVLWDTTGNNPFQIAIDPDRNKIYWTEWSGTARIMCANLDGTGSATAIASGLYYPTGMQVSVTDNSLYVYFGFNAPVSLAKASLGTGCAAITLNTIANTSLPLAYNLSIDPPGSRLFFVDYNANNIAKINTDGTGLNLNLWAATSPGDQLRDIIYNKNSDQLFWIYTNGTIQRANADGTGSITDVVSGIDAQSDSRSIDMCVDSVGPRLASFTTTTSNGSYCPGSTINIRATYDETLGSGSTMTVVLNTGASVTLSTISTNTLSGSYTVGATGSGQNTSDLSVSSISSEAVVDSYNNTRTNSAVPASPNNIADTANIVVDTTGPTLTQVTAAPNPTTNRNPPYTFSTNTAGAITYGGACASVTGTAVSGNNTINLASNTSGAQLADGLYSNCTISMIDSPSCNVSTLNISAFRVAATVPTVTLSIDNATIAENSGSSVIVTATLSNIYALATTVNLAFSGTATNVTDYTRSAISIVIPALSTTGTITITPVDDILNEANETVIVDISSVTNGTESGTQQVTTTIIDDESNRLVTLSVNNSTISESGGIATFTATLSSTSPSIVTVNLSFSGTATGGGTDYSVSANAITIPANTLSASMTVSAVDDPTYENDETVVVDISSVVNATESGTQQEDTSIEDDQTCNYDPAPNVTGLSQFLTISLDGSFDPNAAYSPPDGSDFDTIVMGRNAAQVTAWRDEAVDYFLTKYGIDFTSGNSAQSGNIVLVHRMLDPLYNTRIHAMTGKRLAQSGGAARSGYYAMIVVGSTGTLTGTWGGAGTSVPYGSVAEFGEYAIDLPQLCKDSDGDNETGQNDETIYLAFQSKRPYLTDFISYNGSLFMDIPAINEVDLIAGDGVHTYVYTNGVIDGRKELRQINNNLVRTNGTLFVEIP